MSERKVHGRFVDVVSLLVDQGPFLPGNDLVAFLYAKIGKGLVHNILFALHGKMVVFRVEPDNDFVLSEYAAWNELRVKVFDCA